MSLLVCNGSPWTCTSALAGARLRKGPGRLPIRRTGTGAHYCHWIHLLLQPSCPPFCLSFNPVSLPTILQKSYLPQLIQHASLAGMGRLWLSLQHSCSSLICKLPEYPLWLLHNSHHQWNTHSPCGWAQQDWASIYLEASPINFERIYFHISTCR